MAVLCNKSIKRAGQAEKKSLTLLCRLCMPIERNGMLFTVYTAAIPALQL